MENFAIDLDKVLDEFELNEDQAINLVTSDHNSDVDHDGYLDKNYYMPSGPTIRYDSPFEPTTVLNLEEADFGPSAKTASTISNYHSDYPSQNGHISSHWKISTLFVPEDPPKGCTDNPNRPMNGSISDDFCENNDNSILYHKEVIVKKKSLPSVEDDSLASYSKRNYSNDFLDDHLPSKCSLTAELAANKKTVISSDLDESKKYTSEYEHLNDISCSGSGSHLTEDPNLINNHEPTTFDCNNQMTCNNIGISVQESSTPNEVNERHSSNNSNFSIRPQLTIEAAGTAVGFGDLDDVSVSDDELEAYLSADVCGLTHSPNKELAELDFYLKTVEGSGDSTLQEKTGTKPKHKICPQTEIISDHLNEIWDNISIETPAVNENSEPITWNNIKLGVESLHTESEVDNSKEYGTLVDSFSVVNNSSSISDKESICDNTAETNVTELSVKPCTELSVTPCIELSVKPCTELSIKPCTELSVTPCIELSVKPCIELSLQPCTKHPIKPCTEQPLKPCIEIYPAKPCTEQAMTWNDINLDLITDTVRLNIKELPAVIEENEITSVDLKIHEPNLEENVQQTELLNHVSFDSLPSEIICNINDMNDTFYGSQNHVYCENNNDLSLDMTGTSRPQKRPTSLNLPPRAEFNPNRNRDSSDSPMTPIPEDSQLDEALNDLSDVSPSSSSTPTIQPQPTLSERERMLGKVPPYWIPDIEASNCMQCEIRFTMIKRRHHCRACGKVLCSSCCNVKSKLVYMDNKEARVCHKCQQTLSKVLALERRNSPSRAPNPNNPSEYCSTVPPLQQAQAALSSPPPTVMVPVGVLKREGSKPKKEPKQVMFSDGIRPGGDLTELDGSAEPRQPYRRQGRLQKKVEKALIADSNQPRPVVMKTRTLRPLEISSCFTSLIPDACDQLPPILVSTGSKGEVVLEDVTDQEKLMDMIRIDDDSTPVVFAVNKNLFVLVKIIHLDCCVNRTCWCFTTKGMCTVGQDEIVIILECLPEEKTIPRDIFCHFNTVYEEASKGNTVGDLSHTIFNQNFLDSREHGGFLYVRPTFQCLHKLILPSSPYVVGILLQKWETPWVKVFPIRLLLRLGAEFRYYPCPLVSVRFRKPVYGEVGHTIMNLLADFRNYQYMLTCIKGVAIHMEDKKTYINFPKNRYDEVMKVLNNSNEHVLALGANFSMDADSHLVCVQNDDGNYQTQAINIQNKPRKVTGASFVVFNGALKSSSGLTAKSSIVEDGLMVQIFAECLSSLKQSLRDMREYTIECGPTSASQPDELVTVRWADDDKNVNIGVISPIDHSPMDGISSVRIHNSTDYMGEHLLFRWTEVFFVQNDESANQSRLEPVDLSRLSETVAQACCIALTGHLEELKKANMIKIGLRVTIEAEKVGYEVGSSGCKLPAYYMNALDNELIPVIHRAASHSQEGAIILELIFHVLEY